MGLRHPVAVVLQCVAVCCSVWQCVYHSVMQCVAVCCSVLQLCCSTLQYIVVWHPKMSDKTALQCDKTRAVGCSCVAVCCSTLQCVAARYLKIKQDEGSVLQLCCIVWQYVAVCCKVVPQNEQ